MNINDKIKHILIDKNLSPSYFADEIGVQRSSISHILSGRNRPSFDIIQKIIRRFPDLGYDWILEEDSQISTQTPQRPTKPAEVNSDQPLNRSKNAANPQPRNTQPETETTDLPTPSPVVVTPQATGEKKIERILVFYADGTFKEYSPM